VLLQPLGQLLMAESLFTVARPLDQLGAEKHRLELRRLITGERMRCLLRGARISRTSSRRSSGCARPQAEQVDASVRWLRIVPGSPQAHLGRGACRRLYYSKHDRALCGVDSPLCGFIADAGFATACFLSPFLESRHASILSLIMPPSYQR
jgi:hypothetical protein